MSKTSKFKSDFRGALFESLRIRRLKWSKTWSTTLAYMRLRMMGVEIGKDCKFFGKALIRRSPMTEIKIGDKCSFRSSFESNLVGLNRGCLIVTWFDKAKIEIGDRVGMSGAVIGAKEYIKIGNDVMVGGNALITDFDWHPIHPAQRHRSDLAPSAPTIIEDNVWIGMNAVVLKGVTIGKNTVIAANSVVTRDIPANVIAGGNPCKVLKEMDPDMLKDLSMVAL
ncbi:MAG: acyltransferase [Bacteroidota bacterium]